MRFRILPDVCFTDVARTLETRYDDGTGTSDSAAGPARLSIGFFDFQDEDRGVFANRDFLLTIAGKALLILRDVSPSVLSRCSP